MAHLFGLIVMAICPTCAVWANEQTEQTFPYVAYVVSPETYLRSGPGGRHYATGKLSLGYAVEVYRHDDNSWCAIRPPDGSFSWIPAHQTRIRGDGTAEILGEQTVARVGSQLSDHLSVVQVLLQQGELVKLHGDLVSGDGRWIAIQPPAGEFRWIRVGQISRTPPAEVARPVAAFSSAALPAPSPQAGWQAQHARPPNGPSIPRSSDETEIIAGSPADSPPVRSGPETPSALGPGHDEGLPAGNNDNHPPRIRFHGISTRGQDAIQAESPVGGVDKLPSGMRPLSREDTRRLEQLQLQLSRTIIQDPPKWQFHALRKEADQLLSQTDSIHLRTQLDDLLRRIELFEQVRSKRIAWKHRQTEGGAGKLSTLGSIEEDPFDEDNLAGISLNTHHETPQQRAQADLGLRPLQSADRGRDDLVGAPTEDASKGVRYDAAGKLTAVISDREYAPRYALVDEQGKVISFVTPKPDLNLQPYLGRRIGVHGRRGFMPELRRAHVTASRVTPIQTKLR